MFLETEVDPLEIERDAKIPDRVIAGLKKIGALVTDEMLMVRPEHRASVPSFREQLLAEARRITLPLFSFTLVAPLCLPWWTPLVAFCAALAIVAAFARLARHHPSGCGRVWPR